MSDREPGFINGVRARCHDLVVFPEGAELDYVLPAETEWCTLQLERDAFLTIGILAEGIRRFSVIAPKVGHHVTVWRLLRSAVDGFLGVRE